MFITICGGGLVVIAVGLFLCLQLIPTLDLNICQSLERDRR